MPAGAAAFLAALLLNSCFGANMDISLNQNGGGVISLEYRISKSLDSIGRLDGNERWNTIPVGRADFERSIARLPDIRLLSFGSKENGTDILIEAKMEFVSLNGLLAFLDASGRRAALSGDARSGRLLLTLSDGKKAAGEDLEKLILGISGDYSIKLGMSFPGEGSLAISDLKGAPLSPVYAGSSKGKKVSCAFPLADVLLSPGGINVEFAWQR